MAGLLQLLASGVMYEPESHYHEIDNKDNKRICRECIEQNEIPTHFRYYVGMKTKYFFKDYETKDVGSIEYNTKCSNGHLFVYYFRISNRF